MKEWCLQHPWMTFFTLIFTIWIVSKNINSIFRGKMEFMENSRIKGVMKMSNGNSINSGNGSPHKSSSRPSQNERGSQTVKPPTTSSPPPPPNQK